MPDAAGHKVIISSSVSLCLHSEEMQRTKHVTILIISQAEFHFLWVDIAKLSIAFPSLLWVQNHLSEHCFTYAEIMILITFW